MWRGCGRASAAPPPASQTDRRIASPRVPASPSSAALGLGIDVEHVVAGYGGAPVLHAVDLSIKPGEIVSLLGPSGCGKTTLLRCIAGLETPTSGVIRIGDRDVTAGRGVAPERRRVGMVFQDGALFPHRSVRNNVNYGLSRQPDRERRTMDALRLVGLDTKADRMPGTLSGGEQQRVALARAIAPNPGVMLLDEPFSSLDAALRVRLREEVRSLLASLGITTLLVTHDQHEALSFGDRVGVLEAGCLHQFAPPAEVYGRPATAWVARFVGEATLLPAVLTGGTAVTILGTMPTASTAHGEGTVMLRPEQVELVDGSRGTVTSIEYIGPSTRYEVVIDDGLVVLSAAPGPPTRRPGDSVDVHVRTPIVHAWPGDGSGGTGEPAGG